MVCYRRYGHNEGDEPAFTQPRMYELIEAHRSVRKLYTETLVNRGDLTLEEAEAALDDFRARLDARVRGDARAARPQPDAAGRRSETCPTTVETVAADRRCDARRVLDAGRRRRSSPGPTASRVHPKLERILQRRRTEFDADAGRLGARRGARVRLAGARGHAGAPRRPGHPARHVQPAPRRARRPRRPRPSTCRSRTSRRRPGAVHALRLGALGVRRARLRVRLLGRGPATRSVGWEAQFGDFVNGAQIIIDQFIVAAEDKWGQQQQPRAAAPPRLRGPGPRALERAHRALPRAVRRGQPARRLPDDRGAVLPRAAPPVPTPRRASRSICFTPKRYLRMPQTRSPVDELTDGGFQRVLDDPAPTSTRRPCAGCSSAPARSATS